MLEKEFVTYKRDAKRLDRKEDALRWWKTRDGFTWPSLSELSDIVLATPASQYPQKLSVWAGIYNDKLVGPLVLRGNLDGATYLELLQDAVIPRVVQIIEDDDEDFNPIFQQGGAPPHYALAVRAYLHSGFPGSWIGRRGSIKWPPRSPELPLLNFFLWGHLKGIVTTHHWRI
ncbi:unnamed protein product [Bemisia tabaci]|uniref:Uncharacterized protein n=1 Tax=Bemisia tabaci TaxID=7038 RepID=A0A9P0F4B5_BEMTA|nr:unnamed protein product [Bemisia tabaci]